MFTRCQHCHTWFRIGSADVRAAHGQVRCGFCGEEFNALKTLCDTLPAESADGQLPEVSGASQENLGAAVPPEADDALVQPADDAPAEEGEPPLESLESAEFEEALPPVIEDAAPEAVDATQPADVDAEDAGAEVESALTGETQAEETIDSPADLATSSAVAERAGLSRRRTSSTHAPAGRAPRPPRRWLAPLAWGVGSLILLLGLLTQAVIYEHDALRNNPATRGAIESIYAAFGHPLPPRRDLAALTISQAEVTSAPHAAGALLVTAALTNRAAFGQPYPLLQVSLTNRFGNVIGEGMFKPHDYLPQASKAMLAPGETQAVRLRIVDPGTAAVGFKIVPCVPVADGTQCGGNENKSE